MRVVPLSFPGKIVPVSAGRGHEDSRLWCPAEEGQPGDAGAGCGHGWHTNVTSSFFGADFFRYFRIIQEPKGCHRGVGFNYRITLRPIGANHTVFFWNGGSPSRHHVFQSQVMAIHNITTWMIWGTPIPVIRPLSARRWPMTSASSAPSSKWTAMRTAAGPSPRTRWSWPKTRTRSPPTLRLWRTSTVLRICWTSGESGMNLWFKLRILYAHTHIHIYIYTYIYTYIYIYPELLYYNTYLWACVNICNYLSFLISISEQLSSAVFFPELKLSTFLQIVNFQTGWFEVWCRIGPVRCLLIDMHGTNHPIPPIPTYVISYATEPWFMRDAGPHEQERD